MICIIEFLEIYHTFSRRETYILEYWVQNYMSMRSSLLIELYKSFISLIFFSGSFKNKQRYIEIFQYGGELIISL